MIRESLAWEDLKKGPDGLVPVIVIDAEARDVLMMAYMDEEAYETTLRTGRMTYHSRSRNALWVKGETSGHFQNVRRIFADCDKDTLLAEVEQIGGIACHTGARSCFFRCIYEENQ